MPQILMMSLLQLLNFPREIRTSTTNPPSPLGNECPQMKCPLPIISKELRSLPTSPLPDYFSNESQAYSRTTAITLRSMVPLPSPQTEGAEPAARGRRRADDIDLPRGILCANAVSRIPYFPKVPKPTE